MTYTSSGRGMGGSVHFAAVVVFIGRLVVAADLELPASRFPLLLGARPDFSTPLVRAIP